VRWFITEDVHDLSRRLADAGETVVSTPDDHINRESLEEMKDYRLGSLLKQKGEVDILVLSNLTMPPLYEKSAALLWQKRHGGIVIGLSSDDPQGEQRNRTSMRGCAVGISHISIYVSNDPASVRGRISRRCPIINLEAPISSWMNCIEDWIQRKCGNDRVYE